MSDQTDFIALYSELGLEPDCSVDAFRLAYRRRVADLHPDRVGASGEDDLKSLNLRYAAALEFHRHYGRLPGAPSAPAARRRPDPVEPPQWPEDAPPAGPVMRKPSKVVVYGIMLVAMLLVWWLSRTDAEPPGFHGVGIAGNERETASPTATVLRKGMSPREVVAMLGEPISREHDDTHWSYGPSWVRFDCAELVDWYSSPLQPLKGSRSRPSGARTARPDGDAVRRCASGSASSNRQWHAP